MKKGLDKLKQLCYNRPIKQIGYMGKWNGGLLLCRNDVVHVRCGSAAAAHSESAEPADSSAEII